MTDKIKTSRRAVKGLYFLAKDCSGATAIEYALIAGGISIAIVASVSGVGSAVVGLFTAVAGAF